MKSLSDLVNDSEDCSGEPAKAISISVTHLSFDTIEHAVKFLGMFN